MPLPEPATLAALLALVPDQLPAIYAWRDDLQPILDDRSRGREARLAALAAEREVPAKTVRKKFDAFRHHGVAGLINKRLAPALWETKEDPGLPEADRELIKTWCEKFQRKVRPALEAMLRAWRAQALPRELLDRGLGVPHTETPLDPLTGYPRGWSLRNLRRYAPSEYELKAARIGRAAARAHLPLVYTTRAHLYVGQFYLWDDLWHDHEVVDLDHRKRGRPLEFHGLDLASGCKFAWGSRTRVESEVKHEGLKSADFRFVLAAALANTGYHPTRGTTLIVEHGTAAIPGDLEAMLSDATGGMIRVARGGMEGAAAHAGQWAGRAKGNFRFKAALESLGNLIHNELAALPAQVGMDRAHCPEEMHDGGRMIDAATGRGRSTVGRNKLTDALLAAFAELPPERAQWLAWDRCTIQQFRLICEEVYARINRRTQHELEGWDERFVPDRLGGMRRLSPWEVFVPGRRALRPVTVETAALMLGSAEGEERRVIGHKISLNDGSVSGDELRFDATGVLRDREKYRTVLNPFDAGRLFCFDAKGRFVAVLPRLRSVDRGDAEAVRRACAEAARREAQLLQPLRQRHLAEGRRRAERSRHNAAVLAGRTAADRAERARLREESAPLHGLEAATAAHEPAADGAPALSPSDFLA